MLQSNYIGHVRIIQSLLQFMGESLTYFKTLIRRMGAAEVQSSMGRQPIQQVKLPYTSQQSARRKNSNKASR